MARRNRTFTIYDKMEQDGVFEANPANIDSRGPHGEQIYKKQDFPKMVYHPRGEFRITNPGEWIGTVMGPKLVGSQSELISKTVNDAEELAEARAEGWHLTPSASVAAGPGGVPDMGKLQSQASAVVPAGADASVALATANRKMEEMLAQMASMQGMIEKLQGQAKAEPELLAPVAVPASTVKGKATSASAE